MNHQEKWDCCSAVSYNLWCALNTSKFLLVFSFFFKYCCLFIPFIISFRLPWSLSISANFYRHCRSYWFILVFRCCVHILLIVVFRLFLHYSTACAIYYFINIPIFKIFVHHKKRIPSRKRYLFSILLKLKSLKFYY